MKWSSPCLRVSVVTLGVLTVPLAACWEPELRSVHFNQARPDFLRQPQPWRGVPSEARALELPAAPAPEEEIAALEKRARAAEAAGSFPEALAAWKRARRLREREGDTEEVAAASLPDRLAALAAWRGPRDTASLRRYLRARNLMDAGRGAAALALLAPLTSEPWRARAAYLRAAYRFHAGDRDGAARAFAALAGRDPLAAYMAARSLAAPYWKRETAPPEARAPLAEAAHRFDAAARTGGLLRQDALGMAAGCFYRSGDLARALLRYCRVLAELPPGESHMPAWLSTRACLRRMTLPQHLEFQRLAGAGPEAVAYVDLHLHYGLTGLGANHRLGLFALEVLARKPSATLSGRLLARLSLVEARAGRPERALRLAEAAVPRCRPGAARDEARWQRVRLWEQAGRRAEARREFAALASGAAAPRLRRGAAEAAALLAEREGDFADAVRRYFALGYRLDAAYLLDCLAAPQALEAFLRRWPAHPQARLVRYSLAFRRLRAGEYAAAEREFAALGSWLEQAERAYPCSTSRDGPRVPPRRVARFLRECAAAEAGASSPAEAAAHAYRAARFLFHQRHLVFYNGALWRGERTWAFDLQGGPLNVRDRRAPLDEAEVRLLERYHDEHAALAQALRRFERISATYPATPEAPRALYSAALCRTFLPTLELWWSGREKPELAGAQELYHRIQREYPSDPLAAAARKYGGPPPPDRRAAR